LHTKQISIPGDRQSGGARMMESAFSLMQLAKTSGKLSQLSDAKLPYISLLTDPTFGGISASFGMLGDLNIAEPGALIGFAGPSDQRNDQKRSTRRFSTQRIYPGAWISRFYCRTKRPERKTGYCTEFVQKLNPARNFQALLLPAYNTNCHHEKKIHSVRCCHRCRSRLFKFKVNTNMSSFKASRENKNGWIYVHLEGSPSDIGYQHGYLLASDIDTSIQSVAYLLQHDTRRDWQFLSQRRKKFLWDKLDREYKDEINGIVEGLHAQNKNYDSLDLTAYNALEELAFYYAPMLDNLAKAGSGNNKAPGNCSAFIATGSYTKDGKIVIGHNNWTEYIIRAALEL
jgi:hypothetical protein